MRKWDLKIVLQFQLKELKVRRFLSLTSWSLVCRFSLRAEAFQAPCWMKMSSLLRISSSSGMVVSVVSWPEDISPSTNEFAEKKWVSYIHSALGHEISCRMWEMLKLTLFHERFVIVMWLFDVLADDDATTADVATVCVPHDIRELFENHNPRHWQHQRPQQAEVDSVKRQ